MSQAKMSLTPSQEHVFGSMVELLSRAGLEYRGGFVQAGLHRVHYLDYGTGPAVLLIHGGGAGGAVWFRQIAALSARFRVIAPDNPLFGLSSRPKAKLDVSQATTEYIDALMDALEIEKASFAGLSMGGFASALFAATHPDRVERLALVNSAGFGRDLPWGFRLGSLPFFKSVLSAPHRWAHERFFSSMEVAHPEAEHNSAYLNYAYCVTQAEGHSLALRRNLPGYANLLGQKNMLDEAVLASIQAPTLVIWGEQDRFFPLSHALRAQSLIAGAQLSVLPDCGHIALLDQPAKVNRLLVDFFSGISGAESVAG